MYTIFSFDKQINTLFTISHIGTFNISIQALMLIFQVSLSRQVIIYSIFIKYIYIV